MSGIEDDDLGAPVDLSALLDDEGDAPAVDRSQLSRRIERRQVGADLTTFFWVAPAEILRGFLQGMLGAPRPAAERDDG